MCSTARLDYRMYANIDSVLYVFVNGHEIRIHVRLIDRYFVKLSYEMSMMTIILCYVELALMIRNKPMRRRPMRRIVSTIMNELNAKFVVKAIANIECCCVIVVTMGMFIILDLVMYTLFHSSFADIIWNVWRRHSTPYPMRHDSVRNAQSTVKQSMPMQFICVDV